MIISQRYIYYTVVIFRCSPVVGECQNIAIVLKFEQQEKEKPRKQRQIQSLFHASFAELQINTVK